VGHGKISDYNRFTITMHEIYNCFCFHHSHSQGGGPQLTLSATTSPAQSYSAGANSLVMAGC
jgi:hypothetical protein